MIDRPGMQVTWRELPNGQRVGVIGQVAESSSTSQGAAAVAKFEAMIDSGEYSYVIGQRSVRRACGLAELGKDAGSVGREIPDIIGIRPDGKIDRKMQTGKWN